MRKLPKSPWVYAATIQRATRTKHLFTIVNVHSLPDDRTARARIRDEALRLFAERGPDAVTMRDIAGAAGVSAALLIRHYGSKEGLVEAVDTHVVATFDALLTTMTEQTAAVGLDPMAAPNLLDGLATHLPPDSAIPAYLSRLLTAGGPAATIISSVAWLSRKSRSKRADPAGTASPGEDTEVRAAFLLINDLAVLTLRPRLTEVLGVDPLSAAGMRRWAGEVFAIYRDGLVPLTQQK